MAIYLVGILIVLATIGRRTETALRPGDGGRFFPFPIQEGDACTVGNEPGSWTCKPRPASVRECEQYRKDFPEYGCERMGVGNQIEMSYLVEIFNANRITLNGCGGVLISKTFILTSGKCAKHDNIKYVRAGIQNRTPYLEIAQGIGHPQANNFVNDIGLISLKAPVTFNDDLRPICLPQTVNFDERPLIVAGQEFNTQDFVLSQFKFNTNAECAVKFSLYNPANRQFCGTRLKVNSCKMRYGSAVLARESSPQSSCSSTLYALLLTPTETCALEVFIRVAPYVEWIESVVWPN